MRTLISHKATKAQSFIADNAAPLRYCVFLILAALVWLSLSAKLFADDRPNIVLIMAEDAGRDWVSCYGAKHQTPNVDRLATQGVIYQTTWATPSGTVSSATLLTGQYPHRHGWTHDVPRGEGLSSSKFTTFARPLRDSGYSTLVAGSWCLNNLDKQPDAVKRHGFDEHCVWSDTKVGNSQNAERTSNAHVTINGRRQAFSAAKANSFLVDFIQRKADGPFLVYCSMPIANFKLRDQVAQYAKNVSALDQLVGKLVIAIDDAGIKQKTLIVFTSSNGSRVAGTLNGKPYRKGKGEQSDIGAHVPFIVRAPFLTDGGRISRDLIDFTDIYPTLLELARIKSPPNATLDGRSFVPSLRGSEDPFEKRSWIYSQLGDVRMIRDWHHILDSKGNFHDLNKDPLQQHKVSPQDKIAPGRRQRLQMILDRFSSDVPLKRTR